MGKFPCHPLRAPCASVIKRSLCSVFVWRFSDSLQHVGERWVVKRTGFNAKECRPENLVCLEMLLTPVSIEKSLGHFLILGSFVSRNVRSGRSVGMFQFCVCGPVFHDKSRM